MKLYTNPVSPNCRKVLITASILGIPLEPVTVDIINGEHRKPDFLALNPNGKVPALKDGDMVLWESNAITQYLASKKPGNSLWPNDERVRVDITRWQSWELAHWLPALYPYLWENMFKKMLGIGDSDPTELKKAEEKFQRFAGVLNSYLTNRDYLVGKSLTLADISVASHLMFAQPAKLPLENYPYIERWFGQIEKLPAWQETALPAAA